MTGNDMRQKPTSDIVDQLEAIADHYEQLIKGIGLIAGRADDDFAYRVRARYPTGFWFMRIIINDKRLTLVKTHDFDTAFHGGTAMITADLEDPECFDIINRAIKDRWDIDLTNCEGDQWRHASIRTIST